MSDIECIYYSLEIVFDFLFIGGFVWFIVSLFKVRNYEKGINQLHNELRSKIESEKARKASMETINIRIRHLKEEYKPRIEKLERQRRFILDKLPLIK